MVRDSDRERALVPRVAPPLATTVSFLGLPPLLLLPGRWDPAPTLGVCGVESSREYARCSPSASRERLVSERCLIRRLRLSGRASGGCGVGGGGGRRAGLPPW